MEQKKHTKTDYSQITNLIYLGSNLCSGWTCPIHSEEFLKLGIDAEINLISENMETIVPELDAYLLIPTPDHSAPSLTQLHLAADMINSITKTGKTIYIHCKNGHGRSPTALIAYYVKYKNMTAADAEELVKKKRPEIHLTDDQHKTLQQFAAEVG